MLFHPVSSGSEVKHGDIITFRSLKDEKEIYIKRVIGLPEDVITYDDGTVYRNGEPICENTTISGILSEPLTVPENTIFVLGDNYEVSRDSRSFGPVPYENIELKVRVITRRRNIPYFHAASKERKG